VLLPFVRPLFAGLDRADAFKLDARRDGALSRVHAHHIVFRAAAGGDAPENLTTLCAFHHQRGVHAGRVRVTGTALHRLGFELGTREGQPPLARYRARDRRA